MIIPFNGKLPQIHETAFIAPSADLIGDVVIGGESSVWFQTVIRGDVNFIRIGDRTNIQDKCMLHVTRKKAPLVIGSDVTVGHSVTLHGATLGNRILVGMGAIIMDHAVIQDDVVIAAGALVTEGAVVESGTLWMGSPAKKKRDLTKEEIGFLVTSARNYVVDSRAYGAMMLGPERLDTRARSQNFFVLTEYPDSDEEPRS